MAGKPKYTQMELRKAIEGSFGIKATVVRRLGCAPQTLDNYLARRPELRALLAAESDSIIDTAESKLVEALHEGDWRAVQFTLETKGKGRGWVKRSEVTGANGTPLGLSAETMALLQSVGVTAEEVTAQFELMIREQVAALKNP